jgi:hypothetical protein
MAILLLHYQHIAKDPLCVRAGYGRHKLNIIGLGNTVGQGCASPSRCAGETDSDGHRFSSLSRDR